MKGNLNRSDHVILAIVSAFGVYVFLFGYFQLTEYKQSIEIVVPENLSRIEEKKQIEIPIKNIEVPTVSSKEIKNIVRNKEDKRIKSDENWSENTPTGDPEKTIKEYEKKLKVKFVLLNKESPRSKCATLFFLSKNSFNFDKILFPNDYKNFWDEVDILITDNPKILKKKPKNKISIKVKNEFNLDIKSDFTIINVNNIKEIKNIIKTIKEKI